MSGLSTNDHSRDKAGMTYVYPVLSRRSSGLSIGINLNPNNACNWSCIYCQVPNLQRGNGPNIDLVTLESELRRLLRSIKDGSFAKQFEVSDDQSQIMDIAISGNGEPTSSPQFPEVIQSISKVLIEFDLLGIIKMVLITNGSHMTSKRIQQSLSEWSRLGGEVWVKCDSALEAGIRTINGVNLRPSKIRQHIKTSARLCKTWIQTCFFSIDNAPPSPEELKAYLDFLHELKASETKFQGVLLYGIARPSMQPEGNRLTSLPPKWFDQVSQAISDLGIEVKTYV